jgi:hypothetical protein
MMQLHRANMFKPAAGGGGGGAPAGIVNSKAYTAKSTSWSTALPTGTGDLYVAIIVWNDSASPVSITGADSASWLELCESSDGSNEASVLIAWIDAADVTDANLRVSMDSDRECTAIIVLFDGWDGVTAPVADFHDTNSSKITSPNPPSLAYGWTGDVRALCGFGFRDEESVSATPSGFSYLADDSRGGRAWNYCVEGVISGGSPVDPGAFTCTSDREAVAYTILIPGT